VVCSPSGTRRRRRTGAPTRRACDPSSPPLGSARRAQARASVSGSDRTPQHAGLLVAAGHRRPGGSGRSARRRPPRLAASARERARPQPAPQARTVPAIPRQRDPPVGAACLSSRFPSWPARALLIRRFPHRHPDLFRPVRDLGHIRCALSVQVRNAARLFVVVAPSVAPTALAARVAGVLIGSSWANALGRFFPDSAGRR
jgi:hypothetical protein